MNVHFSSQTADWASPPALKAALSDEFGLSFDPCPIGGAGGLEVPWFGGVYVNPPYGPSIPLWLDKAFEEMAEGRARVVVFLLPARTDTKWWHDQVLPNASEIRFIRGRLKFGGAENVAPFPSVVIVFGERPPNPEAVGMAYNDLACDWEEGGESCGHPYSVHMRPGGYGRCQVEDCECPKFKRRRGGV